MIRRTPTVKRAPSCRQAGIHPPEADSSKFRDASILWSLPIAADVSSHSGFSSA